jgi:hypothetical protein
MALLALAPAWAAAGTYDVTTISAAGSLLKVGGSTGGALRASGFGSA